MSKLDELIELDKDGGRYVAVSALMHPMVAMADGLSVSQFGRSGRWYLRVEDALAWIDREVEIAQDSRLDKLQKSREVLIALRDAPEDILTGGPFRLNNITQRMEPTNA